MNGRADRRLRNRSRCPARFTNHRRCSFAVASLVPIIAGPRPRRHRRACLASNPSCSRSGSVRHYPSVCSHRSRMCAASDDGRLSTRGSGRAPITFPQRRQPTFFPASLCSASSRKPKKPAFPPSSALLQPFGCGPIASRRQHRHRGRNHASPTATGELIMATIGTFTKSDDGLGCVLGGVL